jgi:hypothetical protein
MTGHATCLTLSKGTKSIKFRQRRFRLGCVKLVQSWEGRLK